MEVAMRASLYIYIRRNKRWTYPPLLKFYQQNLIVLSYVCTLRLIGLISYPGECDLMVHSRKHIVIFSRMHFVTFVRIRHAVAKLVVMLVMLSMTKHFLKMYVFFVRFYLFYFILFFNRDFFYILDILVHDICGYFRIFRFQGFPHGRITCRICCLWQQSCQPCSAGPSRRVGKALA